MAKNKKNSEIEQQFEEEKEFYDKILDDAEPYVNEIQKNVKNLEVENRKKEFVDFSKVKEISETKSNDTIKQFVKFFIPDVDLQNSEFLKVKMDLDRFVLSKIIFQVETCEFAITKLLELIDEGIINPRNFEVLSGLQKTSVEMIRFMVQLQNVMELTYRNYYDSYLVHQAEQKMLAEKIANDEIRQSDGETESDTNFEEVLSSTPVRKKVTRLKYESMLSQINTDVEVVDDN